MSDRKLLEHAASAAGLTIIKRSDAEEPLAPLVSGWHNGLWRPLTDDGHALRLAVKMGISISFSHSTLDSWDFPAIVEVGAFAGWCPTFTESNKEDWPAATRRAIVRAVAAMDRGDSSPSQGTEQ